LITFGNSAFFMWPSLSGNCPEVQKILIFGRKKWREWRGSNP